MIDIILSKKIYKKHVEKRVLKNYFADFGMKL